MSKPYVFGFLILLCLSCRQGGSGNLAFTHANNYQPLINVASAKLDLGQVNEAFHYLDSSYDKLGNISESAKMQKYTFFCNVYYNTLFDYNNTGLYADSMLMLVNSSKDKNFVAQYSAVANFSKGDAYFGAKNYNEAFRYYYIAKKIASQNLDSCSLNDYSYRLGMVMFRQEHYGSAADYFKMSWNETNYCADSFFFFYRRQELLNNTGISYAKNGQQDSALVYYNKALSYLKANERLTKDKPSLNDIARAVVYNYKAQLYSEQAKYDSAEELFNESISINSRKGHDNKDAQVAQIHLADLFLKSGQTKKVLPLMKELRKSLDVLKNEEVELSWNELMWKHYKAVNQPVTALYYLQKYVSFKDELAENSKTLREMDVNGQLSALESQYKIESLRRNNHIQRLILAGTIVFGLMACAIIILVYTNNRRSRKNVETLTALNEQIGKKKAQLRKTFNELEQQSQEKDRILRVVAHDLRTPLSGIVGLSGIVIEHDDIDAEQTRMLTLVQNTASDTLQLINEILEVAVPDEEKVLVKQPADINEVLSDTVELLQFKATEKNQTIMLNAGVSHAILPLNREKMARVVSNLISNAIKFSANNENIFVSSQQVNDGILVSVKDTGIGIPEDLKNKIFNVFTTAKRPGTVGEKSFGLGLSICRQIVDAHDGKIWFESDAGKGTTFYVKLPLS
jgi:signal transduction histidine kinase